MSGFPIVPTVIMGVAAVLTLLGLVAALAASYSSQFVGGHVVAVSSTGAFEETQYRVEDYTAIARPPVRNISNVLTSGAAVLNLTIELVSLGTRRSWEIRTEGNGGSVVSSNLPLTFQLSLLTEGHYPHLSKPGYPTQVNMPCSYTLTEPSSHHLCGLFMFPNGTVLVRPERIDMTRTLVPLVDAFDASHVGRQLKLNSVFTWIVS